MARLEELAEREVVKQGEVLVTVEGLKVYFSKRGGIRKHDEKPIRAVDGVSFTLESGRTLSLVGESGCGKSTGRAIARRTDPSDRRERGLQGNGPRGGQPAGTANDSPRHPDRLPGPVRVVQPRMRVRDLLMEPLRVQGIRAPERYAEELLELVGLRASHVDRFAHEFSGGQCQRIGIARALALRPNVLVLDEPIASLDVSLQAQIMNLLMDLQEEFGLAYLLISHDVSVVQTVSHQIGVMYLGQIVETGEGVLDHPQHPYSKALLSAVPSADPEARHTLTETILTGEVPSPADPPSGCRFRTRCPIAAERCAHEVPELIDRTGDGRLTACHFVGRIAPEPALT